MINHCTIQKLSSGFLVSEMDAPVGAFSNLNDVIKWLPLYFEPLYVVDPEKLKKFDLDGISNDGARIEAMPEPRPVNHAVMSQPAFVSKVPDVDPVAKPNLAGKIFEELAAEIKEDRQDAVALAGDSGPVEEPEWVKLRLTELQYAVLTELNNLSEKSSSQQVCISFPKLAERSGTKGGSIRSLCDALLKKGFLKKMYLAGNDAAPVFTLLEDWETLKK